MGFIEKYDFYHYGSRRERFAGLVYDCRSPQGLVNGCLLPRTHGVSYAYCRELMKQEFGDVMAFDDPNLEYRLEHGLFDRREEDLK